MKLNPLLQKTNLPKFDKILPQHFKPALGKIITINRAVVKKLLKQKNFTWDNFVVPLETANDQLTSIWSTICHLNAVTSTKKVRTAYEKSLPLIIKYDAEISQNSKLYAAFNRIIQNKEEYQHLDATQKKILSDKLRDFLLAGVALSPKQKQKFTALKQQLAKLSNKFACNVLDASQSWSLLLTKKQISGLPEHVLTLARNEAGKKKLDGWLFSLDYPSYHALVAYADLRNLRKKIYTAYVTRATANTAVDKKWDNSKIITAILKIRATLAKQLHFKNYAAYSLAPKMAKDPEQVLSFVADLARKTLPAGKKELKELEKFAKKHGIKKLQPWDLAYYEEKLSQEKFKLSQEKLRPYFPAAQVLTGIFDIANRLFGVTVKEKNGVAVWHPEVRFFEVYDATNNLRGQFYLDLYYRDNKRSGAWMDDCKTRCLLKNGMIQPPVAYLVCNFSPPLHNQPALLTHEEALTLLHEFGHCLQHVLTRVNHLDASGIRGVPWDAVELASQFMENWGWQSKGIKLMSKHYQTHKPLPRSLLQKLLASRTFYAATEMLRQLEFSLVDLKLHLAAPAPTMQQIKKIVNHTQKSLRVTPAYKYAQPLHTFSHIFVGGYAAGYYSYKWAELLAADAFGKFEENGIFNRHVGQEFLSCILETGGSEDPMVLFKKFRGREPKVDALLRHYGIR